ncbi:MAG TPA: P1 family peptidase [Thermoanaerobaculia bacterium]|nr:P1 family peptidase [Thermoanaerobaculia bacterium]
MIATRLPSAPLLAAAVLSLLAAGAATAQKPRARDLGIPFDGAPGPLNAITDVAGVTVGHATIVEGEAVRTGVTAVLPRGPASASDPVYAGWYSLNGNGEMTGTTWIEESGFLEGPVMITNTHSVGVVRDAVISWRIAQGAADASGYWWSLPVVAETWDGWLNDINGFHVTESHAHRALAAAAGGAVAEGNVGGGTGMVCYEWKGGIGTASRRVAHTVGELTVGVLVQANFGRRAQATLAGVPVGRAIPEGAIYSQETGSIIVVVATDAPLLPHQLKRLARRVPLGLARTGATSGNGSGDIFVAFSTANAGAQKTAGKVTVESIVNDDLSPLFDATVQAVEEAIVNALVAAETMTGRSGTVQAMPRQRVVELLREHGRLVEPQR